MNLGIYEIADTVIEIRSIHPDVHELCRNYRSEKEPSLTVCTCAEDIAYERRKSAEADTYEGHPVRIFPDGYLETLAVYRKIALALLDKNTLLFHGSAIAVDGEAYLFTAKSGTGKSTHTALWRQKFGSRAMMVNDDKPLLKMENNTVTVYGTPWDGKHRLSTNTSVPLKAICILERAPENHIEKITLKEALPMLVQQSYRPNDPQAMVKTLSLIAQLGQSVSLHRLGCNMNPDAADVSYAGMAEK